MRTRRWSREPGARRPGTLCKWEPLWSQRIYSECSEPYGSRSERDHGPHNTLWRRVNYTILVEHGIIDISRVPASWMWDVQPPLAMHFLRNPWDDATLCGHRFRSGDTVKDDDIGLGSVPCLMCMNRVSQS